MQNLPYELKLQILLKTNNVRDAINTSLTCKKFKQIYDENDNYIIANIYYNQFGEKVFTEDNMFIYKHNLINIDICKRLLKMNYLLNTDYLIKWCASKGHLNIIKDLLPVICDHDTMDMVLISAEYGYFEICKYLLNKCDCYLNSTDDIQILFDEACNFNNIDFIKYLIEQKGITPITDLDSLYLCIINDNLEIFKYFTENNYIPLTDENEFTIANSCATHGSFNILKYLIEKIPTLLEDDDIKILCEILAKKGHMNIVEYLLQKAGKNEKEYYMYKKLFK